MAVLEIQNSRIHLGAIPPKRLVEFRLDPAKYPNQEEVLSYFDRHTGQDVPHEIHLGHIGLALIVQRQEKSPEGLEYLTNTLLTNPRGPLHNHALEASSIIKPINGEEFGLMTGNYGEAHYAPPIGEDIRPEHVRPLGSLYEHLFLPLGMKVVHATSRR
jgi:hypothetical protein